MLPAKRLAPESSGMWNKDKTSPVRRAGSRPRTRTQLLLGSLALLCVLTPAARAQHLPLPPQEQEWVNNAIDRGVRYLKKNQQKSGTWAKPNTGHRVGYAVLPALTLLECGVPPSDPLIQRAAEYVRTRQGRLNETYELALSILFLDRLGDPRDKQIIQTFALRLVAGQSATGGWGYRCPPLGPKVEKELMTALRYVNPPMDIARKPDAKPDIVRQTGPEAGGRAQRG